MHTKHALWTTEYWTWLLLTGLLLAAVYGFTLTNNLVNVPNGWLTAGVVTLVTLLVLGWLGEQLDKEYAPARLLVVTVVTTVVHAVLAGSGLLPWVSVLVGVVVSVFIFDVGLKLYHPTTQTAGAH